MLNKNTRKLLTVIFSITASLFSATLCAHLLPKQHGTLNFTNDGAYMALSLPLSAFENLDANNDGSISMIEFNMHRSDIIRRVETGITLSVKSDAHILQGIMLSPVQQNEHSSSPDEPLSRIYVLGKFVLDGSSTDLYFRNDLYGIQSSERTFKITATRKSDDKKQVFDLTQSNPGIGIFTNTDK